MEVQAGKDQPIVTGERRSAHIPFLDHIRGLAIFMVVAFHSVEAAFGKADLPWQGWFRDFNVDPKKLVAIPAMFGFFGVAVFFALSGFCIHLSHVRSRSQDWKEFFLRRWFRIYPPYLALLLVFCFWPVMVDFRDKWGIVQFVSHFLLIHNLDYRTYFGINPSFWSVAVEFQLYAVYPLFFLAARKVGWRKTLWVLAIIELGLRAVVGFRQTMHPEMPLALPRLLTGSPFYFGFGWTLGAAAADDFLAGRRSALLKWPLWLWPVLGLVCFCVRPLDPFCTTIFSVGTVHAIMWLLDRPARKSSGIRLWLGKHFAFAGVVSYSLYLINQPFIKMAGELATERLGPGHELVVFAICLVVWFPLTGLAWLVFQALEKPAIVWGKAAVGWLRRSAN